MEIPYGKKTISAVEYYAIKDKLRYVIAQKTISGADFSFLYHIYNETDFLVAWATPNLETYYKYPESNDTIRLTELFIVAASGGGGGDASAANQVVGNASLANIDADLGAKADAAATTDGGTFSLISLFKRLLGKFPALGQATMANSQPVVIASNQTGIPIFISDPISLTKATVSATGSLSVGLPATTVFNDSLNGTVIDIINRWNSPVLAGSGTVTQNGTSGLVFTVNTTANNGGQISSQPTFDISGAIQYIFALGVQLETTTISTGNHRFWGLANQGTSYSTSNPIKEGIGFEITTTGVLRAVIYSADAVTFSQNLTIPVDGVEHLYGVFLLGNFIFWYIDQFSTPVAVSGLLQPSNTILPIRLHSLNGGSSTVGTPIFNTFSLAIVDATRNGLNITDGIYGWRRATIKPASTAPVAADTALVVSVSPNQSAIPILASTTSSTGNITTQNLNPNNGVATTNSTVSLVLSGNNTLAIQVTGTYTGALSLQGTIDGTNWITIGGTSILNLNTGTYLSSITSALQSIFQADVGGNLQVRITALAAVTGTAIVTLISTQSASMVALDASLPTGTNSIGSVMLTDTSISGNITTQNLNATGVGTTGSFIGVTNYSGLNTIVFQITGVYTGALTPQVSIDGTNWISSGGINIRNFSTSAYSQTIVSATTGVFELSVAGYPYFRMVALAAVTGTAVITMRASSVSSVIELAGSAALIGNIGAITGTITPGTTAATLGKARNSAIGATDTGVGILSLRNDALTTFGTTGSYNTPIADKYGALIAKDQQRHKRTYSTAFLIVPAATPTDVVQIIGSASTTVSITKIRISGLLAVAGQILTIFQKRSTANTGGTSTAQTLVPHDSGDAAATTVISNYTANPTSLGTSVGNVRQEYIPMAPVTGGTPAVEFKFSEGGKSIVLNGVAQTLCINLNSIATPPTSIAVEIEFTEE